MEGRHLQTLLGALELFAVDELDEAVLRSAALGHPSEKVEHLQLILAVLGELKEHPACEAGGSGRLSRLQTCTALTAWQRYTGATASDTAICMSPGRQAWAMRQRVWCGSVKKYEASHRLILIPNARGQSGMGRREVARRNAHRRALSSQRRSLYL